MERSAWPKNLSSSRKHAIQELLHGQNPSKKLGDLFDAHSQTGNNTGQPLFAEDPVFNALRSFSNTQSLSSGAESDEVLQVPSNACVRSEVSEGSESIHTPVPRKTLDTWTRPGQNLIDYGHQWRTYDQKSIPGFKSRRKTLDTRTRLDHNLIDDGHQWRKYGQKAIPNSEFPRSYFRCTHKHDQGCRATKQVQKINDDPPVCKTIYQGQHTCKSLLVKSSPLILDSPSPGDSSILVSFNTSLTPKQDHNNNPFSSSTFSSMKHEPKLPSEDDLIPCSGCHDGNSSNNNNQSTSSDYYAMVESAREIWAPLLDQDDDDDNDKKTSDTWTRLDHNLIDDGYSWRKYGQKLTLNHKFPRCYFRCAFRFDQKCLATKQVQKMLNDPPVYETVYRGHHTCGNPILESAPIILDSPSPWDSSILFSFNTSLIAKQDNNHHHPSLLLQLSH